MHERHIGIRVLHVLFVVWDLGVTSLNLNDSLMRKHQVLMGTKEMTYRRPPMRCPFLSTSRFDGRLNSVTGFCILEKTSVNLVLDNTRGHG